MKLCSIKYSNYRCFRDLSIDFKTNGSKNITLVAAPNGGGKTEMLFSFWWALYGFDFKKLKGKESTAYALNSALYHELNNTDQEKTETCFVELSFEAEGVEYTIKRSEEYSKRQKQGISVTQSVVLSYIKENGEDALPIEDADEVKLFLNKIIPQKILSGIIFDGERMKQLSSIDEDSKNAVEGVIKHITNEELFEMCTTELEELHRSINKEIRKVCKDTNNTNLGNIQTQISLFEEKLKNTKENLESNKIYLADISAKLDDIYRELEQHRDSQKYEQQRKQLRADKADLETELEKNIEEFFGDLWYGYSLITQKLINCVKEIIQQEDLPLGLTAEAVEELLKKSECICGNCLGDKERELLNALVAKLPPRNIDSTILEMARHAELDAEDMRVKLSRSHNGIKKVEKDIGKKKDEIDKISGLITDGATEVIRELERSRKNLETERVNKKLAEERYERDKTQYENTLASLRVQSERAGRINKDTLYLTQKDKFTDKCLKAILAIDEYNKRTSLKHINGKINEAYSSLSEDYESLGKRLYVIQFDKADKFGMVSYLQSQYDATYARWQADGTLASYLHQQKDEDEIKELIIMKIRESNSTGQSKINTLAFAKAILDYSSEVRESDTTQLSKSYPFLIDSPFTELSGGNLTKSAENIHAFSEQLILMISEDSLSGVRQYIEPYVACSYELQKNDGESNSSLKV